MADSKARRMDLLLWRHADAEEGAPDEGRRLTQRGRKQAARVAAWLEKHLPSHFRVVASPAVRARQTADALGRPYRTDARLAVGASAAAILGAAGWPDDTSTVVVVGHQPGLGQAAALALTGRDAELSVRKAGVWWLSRRVRDGHAETVLRAVIAPDLL